MAFHRFLALGDSITEGLSDKAPGGGYRGWADRVADELAHHHDDFQYANFAVRGKLLEQIVHEQLPVAMSLVTGEPTLLSFHAGANNILRLRVNIEEVNALYRDTVQKINETGVQLVLFTIREINEPVTPLERMWNQRFIPFNNNIREVAASNNAILIDANLSPALGDPRMLAADRLHLSSEGHRRMAAAVLSALQLPHDEDWLEPLPPIPKPSPLVESVKTAGWAALFVVPWLIRRVLGKSSGDRRVAKYPALTPWPQK